ncbi:MAG: hypothetical protein EOO04_14805, partial [Chitinophagaceae bacterium]
LRAGHYRVYSKPETSFWCCVGSGLENHAKYNELIYAHQGNNLFVNLFIPSQLNWKEKGLTIAQRTNFPETEQTSLLIQSVTKSAFTLNIRYPKWVKPGSLTVLLNGKKVAFKALPGQYIAINHKWKKGDEIVIKMDMTPRLEKIGDNPSYIAVSRGPVLFARDTRLNGPELTAVLKPVITEGRIQLKDTVSGTPDVWMEVTMLFTAETYPESQTKPVAISLCDYASAGNGNKPSYFMVWMPQLVDPRTFAASAKP